MDKIEYINLNETARLLGISRNTLHKWISDGVVRAVKIGRDYRIDKNYIKSLIGWSSLADSQKILDEYSHEIRQQLLINKQQLTELRLQNSTNTDIINLRQMSSIVMTRMWKIMSKKAGVTKRDMDMITMAIGGFSSNYIADKMQLSATTVQNTIRNGLKIMESFSFRLDHYEELENLQNQNESLTHENDLLKQNIYSLIDEINQNKGCQLMDTSPQQKEILMKRIDATELPPRVVHAMTKCNVKNVLELVQKTKKELMSIQNLGAKSINQIQKFLELNNLSLNMSIIMDPDTKTLKIYHNHNA